MNSFIESLSFWGDRFLNFAWPMLWQSSLLIAVLFAGDFALRRRLRPAVRYTLWLVLLLKLLMPPSLALPTSVAWWLRANPQPQQNRAEPLKTFIVTYGDTIQSEPLPVLQHVERPRPKPSTAAWLLAGWSVGSVGLFGFLLFRWRQITIQVHQTESAPDWASELFDDVRRELKCRQPVRLRIANRAMSPAVCGFFQPTILLPRALIERLDPDQLRAVLLHELIHLRRGDVWVNCVQALIQVAYWWHPLLWLANARIRRVREEAVDDAVMVALRDNSESCAPTLLEVAKLAFSRPLASLGLVGILESHNALRQRIERLINFRAPRNAGLTLAAFACIFVFAVVAVPMGEPPLKQLAAVTDKEPSPAVEDIALATGTSNELYGAVQLSLDVNPLESQYGFRHPVALVIILEVREDGSYWVQNKQKTLEELRDWLLQTVRPAGAKVHIDMHTNVPLEARRRLSELCKEVGVDEIATAELQPVSSGEQKHVSTNPASAAIPLGIKTFPGNLPATNQTHVQHKPLSITGDRMSFDANTRRVEADGNVTIQSDGRTITTDHAVISPNSRSNSNASHEEPGVPNKPETTASGDPLIRTNVLSAREGRRAIANKLDNIKIRSISFDGVTLSEALNALSEESRRGDPDGKGIDFKFTAGSSPMVDMNTGLPIDVSLLPITIKPAIKDVRLADVLDAIVKVAPSPIRYSIETNAVAIFSSSGKEVEPLYTRTFKVDTNAFLRVLRERGGLTSPINTADAPNIGQSIRTLFASIGVDLQPPKNVFYGDGKGMLLVRATLKDLDAIEQLLQVVNYSPPQINIKVRFVEMPEESVNAFYAEWFGTNRPTASSWSGIMTRQQYSKALQSFEKRKDTEIITGPEVTTVSGRQAQIQMVDMKTIVNGLTTTTTNGETQVDYKTSPMPFGPVLDVIPQVSADGYTIQLTAIPTITEFLGYDDPGPITPHFTNLAEKAQLPLPRFRVRQITTSANVWDGQTLVLGNFSDQWFVTKPDGTSKTNSFSGEIKKQLFVFITPTLIDPAGNRVHKNEEMPSARESAPIPAK